MALCKVASDIFFYIHFYIIKVAGVESVCWQQPLNVKWCDGQSDGLEIEAVFQSLGPCFDALVLTSPSG